MAMNEDEDNIFRKTGAAARGLVDAAKKQVGLVGTVALAGRQGLGAAGQGIANEFRTGYTGAKPESKVVPPSQAAEQSVKPRAQPALIQQGQLTPEQLDQQKALARQQRLSDLGNRKTAVDAQRAVRDQQGGLSNLSEASPEATIVRGTGLSTVNQNDNYDGEFTVWSGTGPDTPEARAAAEADSIRRNVFFRPYDSDAVRTSKIEGANTAADRYYISNTGNAVEREKTAADLKVGLANVGARYNETASAEARNRLDNRTAQQIAETGGASVSPTDQLKQDKALYELAYRDQIRAIDALNITRDAKLKRMAELGIPPEVLQSMGF